MLLYTATAKRALTARIRTPSAMRPRLRASACPRGGGTAPSSRRRASGLAGRVIVVMIRLRSLVQRLDLGHRDGDALRAGRGAEVATAGSADDRPGHVPPHGRGDEIRAIGFARRAPAVRVGAVGRL